MAQKKSGGFALLGIAAAAAAGAYLLYGKNGAKNRKQVKGWMLRAKGEILERLENMEEVSEKAYRETVDAVAKRYEGLKQVDAKDLEALVREAKKHWSSIRRTLQKKGKKPGRRKKS